MKTLMEQIVKFGIIGILATLLDFILMILLKEVFGVNEIIASTISFSISLIFNYICSMKYVFESREDMSKKKEFNIFVILSLIGLGLNTFFMWLLVDIFSIFYIISKAFSTCIVMIWNFVSRKIFLEKKEQ